MEYFVYLASVGSLGVLCFHVKTQHPAHDMCRMTFMKLNLFDKSPSETLLIDGFLVIIMI